MKLLAICAGVYQTSRLTFPERIQITFDDKRVAFAKKGDEHYDVFDKLTPGDIIDFEFDDILETSLLLPGGGNVCNFDRVRYYDGIRDVKNWADGQFHHV